ncbi:hypothetical protein LCM10_07375 [Rossellomorea aquimaris]|uniref:hypothetical protein n=1 Tax=Rossellomorea aquimaris TaxID=189382 RepID=UPI001CD5AF91|nr:hypothetical protein [Rossellomorea aquimaris]MCA1054806.1 hypothetical protein [Rossellomorea aquimaris]
MNFIITQTFKRKYLNNRGFLLPYSMLLFMIVLTAAVLSSSLFLSKYRYLSNMEKVYERKLSIAHGALIGMEQPASFSVRHKGDFGETEVVSSFLNEQELLMEITFQSNEKVFKPVSVVYNRETKQIIDWK